MIPQRVDTNVGNVEFKCGSRQYVCLCRLPPARPIHSRVHLARAELLAKLPFDWAGDLVDLQSAARAPGTSAALLHALSEAADTAHALYAAQMRVAHAALKRIVAANGTTE